MSVRFKETMLYGTAYQIHKDLEDKRHSPDHEDMLIGLQRALQFIDELQDKVIKLENGSN